MKITQVSVEYGRTVNLGNYESERLHAGLTATVGDDETWLDVVRDLGAEVKRTVENQLRESERQRRAKWEQS